MSNVIGLSKKCERNLRRLASYLWNLPKSQFVREHRFDMTTYTDDHNLFLSSVKDCGSVGCAVGHAPFAGIPKEFEESWYSFERRQLVGDEDDFGLLWSHLFSADWACFDNSPQGAAKRILYVLSKGFGKADDNNEKKVLRNKYRRYRPKPSEFGKLPKTVLKRLGLKKQLVGA